MTGSDFRRDLTLPAAWFTAAPELPSVCSRHGLPAVRRVRLAVQSRPPMANDEALSGNVLGMAGRLGSWAQRVKTTQVNGWPLCRLCARTRTTWLTVAAVLFWGGLALVAVAVLARLVSGAADPRLGIPLLAGFAMVIASPFVFRVSSLARIIGSQTSDDGSQLIVRNAHPRFADALLSVMKEAGATPGRWPPGRPAGNGPYAPARGS